MREERFYASARAPLALAAALLLASCAGIVTVPETDLPEAAPRLARPGAQAWRVAPGRLEGAHGCSLAYETYRPAQPRTEVMVLLAHGFLRDLASMRGWAAHWASHGVPVTVVSLRHASLTDARHDRNGEDLVRLARALHPGPVLYAGFSAGGLAAFLASAADPRAAGCLALDAADAIGADAGDGLARSRREELTVPALFLLGEPSACNAHGNILAAIPDRPDVAVLRVRHATHCRFENPTDALCEGRCGSVRPPQAGERIAAAIRALATAWVLERTGALPGAGETVRAGRGVERLQ